MPTIQRCLDVASVYYGVPVKTILSSQQNRRTKDARRAAVWLSRHCTEFSFLELGRNLDRGTATIASTVKSVEEARGKNEKYRRLLDNLRIAALKETRQAAFTYLMRLTKKKKKEDRVAAAYTRARERYKCRPYRFWSAEDRRFLQRLRTANASMAW